VVTTPQEVALLDVRKEISFLKKIGIPVLGVVENMAGFVCPCCKTKSDLFPASSGGAVAMAGEMKVPYIGSIPHDIKMLVACETGKSYLATAAPTSPAVDPFKAVLRGIMGSTAKIAKTCASKLSGLDSSSAIGDKKDRSEATSDSGSSLAAASLQAHTNGTPSSSKMDTSDDSEQPAPAGAGR